MANSASSSLIASLVTANFNALSAAGPISIPGLAVGDIVLNGTVNGLSLWGSFSTFFEPVVSVSGQLQQLSGNLTSPNFVVYFIRRSLI